MIDGATLVLPLAEVIDIGAERARLAKEVKRLETEIEKIDKKLGNAAFIDRAPAEVVEENRERRAEFETSRSKLAEAAARLAAV